MKTINRYLTALSLILLCTEALAQRISDISMDTRVGYETLWLDSSHQSSDTGFRGQWLNLQLDGEITEGLTYSWRHRLNKNTSRNFFDATDWIQLDWKATDRLSLSAGKQVVAIGGYEYDKAPIDLYYCSEFWNNISCYQFGVSATYSLGKSDDILVQICNSPFRAWTGGDSYAYNLMWYGSHGFWETMWSVNLMDIAEGRKMGYIALGNRFNLTDWLHLDVDLMSRHSSYQSFGSDWSVMCELSASPREGVRSFLKYTRDRNHSGRPDDYLIFDGTDISLSSAGLEYTPAGAQSLRLFAAAFYGWGINSNPEGTLLNRQFGCQTGIKWRINILNHRLSK